MVLDPHSKGDSDCTTSCGSAIVKESALGCGPTGFYSAPVLGWDGAESMGDNVTLS
jgi:hypothetical protein